MSGNKRDFRHNQKQNGPPYNYQQITKTLRNNYDQRLNALLTMIRETCMKLENDEILHQMRTDSSLEQFRKQRVTQVISECFLFEKEQYIDQLIETNAFLKSEIKRIELDSNRELLSMQQGMKMLMKKCSDYDNFLNKEADEQNMLQMQYEKLSKQREKERQQYQEFISIKDNNVIEKLDLFQNELSNYQRQIEDVNREQNEFKNELDSLKQKLEIASRQLEIKSNELDSQNQIFQIQVEQKDMLENQLKQNQNIISRLNAEIEEQNEQVGKLENELYRLSDTLENQNRGKNDIHREVDELHRNLRSLEHELKEKEEQLKNSKDQHQQKREILQTKFEDCQRNNESLLLENTNLKHQIEENSLTFEKYISNLQNDMKIIKNQWEKQCQDVQLNSQRQISELQSKHQLQTNQIQTEYQRLLDKKVQELQEESSTYLPRNQIYQKELKAQLDAQVAQIELDYITQSEHKEILEHQMENYRSQNNQKIKELQQRHEREIIAKIREITERKNNEFDILTQGLKKTIRGLENEVDEKQQESRNLQDTISAQHQKYFKLQRQFNAVLEKLKSVSSSLEDNQSELKKKDQDIQQYRNMVEQMQQQLEQMNEKQNEFEDARQNQQYQLGEQLEKSLNQLKRSENTNRQLNKKLSQQSQQIDSLLLRSNQQQQEIENLVKNSRENEGVYADFRSKLSDKDRAWEEKLELSKLELNLKLQNVNLEHQKDQAQLEVTEERRKSEVAELQSRNSALKSTVNELEKRLGESHNKLMALETNLARVDESRRETETQMRRVRMQHQSKTERVLKTLQMSLNYLQNDLKGLQSNATSQFSHFQKFQQQTLQEILFKTETTVSEATREVRQQTENTYQIQIRDLERQLGAMNEENQTFTQRELQNYQNQMKQMKLELENALTENKKLKNNLQSAFENIQELQSAIQQRDEDKDRLEKNISNNEAEFLNLQTHAKKEIKRIQDDANQLIQQIQSSKEGKLRDQLISLQENMTKIKSQHQQEMITIETDINQLKFQNERELNESRIGYESQIQQLSKELNEINQELRRKDDLVQRLKQELNELSRSYQQMKEQSESALDQFEERVEKYKHQLTQDSEKYLQLKGQSMEEVDRLKNQLKRLHKQLAQREETIDELKQAQTRAQMIRAEGTTSRTLKSSSSHSDIHRVNSGTNLYSNFVSANISALNPSPRNHPNMTPMNISSNTPMTGGGRDGGAFSQSSFKINQSYKDLNQTPLVDTSHLVQKSERDIQELQNLIAQSYQTINYSMDQSFQNSQRYISQTIKSEERDIDDFQFKNNTLSLQGKFGPDYNSRDPRYDMGSLVSQTGRSNQFQNNSNNNINTVDYFTGRSDFSFQSQDASSGVFDRRKKY